MCFVYILQSSDGKFTYKGLTDNIERRFRQHFLGKVSSTKDKRPLFLIHVEICATRGEARVLEKFFKSGFGREVIKEIIENS